MNTKALLIGAVVVGILALIGMYSMGITFGRGISGFQGGAVPTVPTFTMYYADWCPHCQHAKPEFKEMASKGEIDVGGKRCAIKMVGLEENPEGVKAARKPINGFPTFLLETPDGEIYEYPGQRNTEGYMKFLNEKLGGGI
jgi:thiol-disulfide isomerase/thioredoxin